MANQCLRDERFGLLSVPTWSSQSRSREIVLWLTPKVRPISVKA